MRVEHWWFKLPLRIKSIFRRRRVESELDEELQFHLEQKTEEEIASGCPPDEARRRALRAMGGLEQRKEEIRDARGVHWLTDFGDDVRYAVRSLRRTPGLTAVVVVTIALGIGMTSMPFSMLDALIFRPYPVADPGGVMTLVSTSRDSRFERFSYREYLDIRGRTKSYDGVVASTFPAAVGYSAEPGATAVVHAGMLVSGNYFRVLGVEPAIGRGFSDAEDSVPGRDAVTVLDFDFWKREFGADRSVVGRKVRLNGVEFTVVGVAPESFPGMMIFLRPEIYVPLAMAGKFSTDPRKKFFVDRDDRELTVRGRLKRATPLSEARNELEAWARDQEREYPSFNRNRGAAVHTQVEMRTQDDDRNWKFGIIVTILALSVLLVACTNAAGLLLARARTRTREIAVRLAIGASRFRLIRLLLTESFILALLGGVGGILIGYGGLGLLRRFTIPVELPVQPPFRMDMRLLLASLGLSVLCALFCGLAPALQSTRTDVVNGLKSLGEDGEGDGRGVGRGRKHLWGRNSLVVAQVAMSLMLLAGSFLMYRGFQSLNNVGLPGSERDHLLMVRFDPRLLQYDEGKTARFYEQLRERVRAVSGVENTTYTQNPPLGLDRFEKLAFVPEGYVMPRDRESFQSSMDTIDEGFFQTMNVPVLRGRGFRPSDTADSPRVAVVNDHFAAHYWPNGEAVGKRFRLTSASASGTAEAVEIVGVAKTIKYSSPPDRPADFVYLPLSQHPVARLVLLVRTTGEPLQSLPPVQDAVRTLDPNMPLVEARSYQDLYRYAAVEGPGIAVTVVGMLGAIGLVLAVAGLYGLVAYNVSRRTREIGIRMAIGAKPFDVVRLMMGKGLVLVATGTMIGLVMGFALERLMNSMLFNGGLDLTVYLIVVPAMAVATMLATYVPARKASRISPTVALRCE